MFKRRTVFIVGAGASHEVGLPIGSELAKIISTKLDIRYGQFGGPNGAGDFDLFDQFRREFPGEVDQYQDAAWLMRLIAPKRRTNDKPVYATAYNMSPSDSGVVKAEILSFFKDPGPRVIRIGEHIKVQDLTCADLFDYFAKSLPG